MAMEMRNSYMSVRTARKTSTSPSFISSPEVEKLYIVKKMQVAGCRLPVVIESGHLIFSFNLQPATSNLRSKTDKELVNKGNFLSISF